MTYFNNAYAAMSFSIQHRWKFVQRTIPNISEMFEPLERAISQKLIPAIIGRGISEEERDILALPVRWGGIGIPRPGEDADFEYAASRKITEPLKMSIINQQPHHQQNKDAVTDIKADVKREKEVILKNRYHIVYSHANNETKRSLEAAREKGASSWLTTMPLDWLGYTLNRTEFRDSLALRYNWSIKDIPHFCACGKKNDINHCLTCKKGGYTIMRHNHIRDAEAKIMREICYDVKVEPMLTPLGTGDQMKKGTNVADQARADISARSVWSPSDLTFVDVRVTHPNAPSNRNKSLEQIYKENEEEKKRMYNDRIMNIERGTFTPLIFLTSGGMSKECRQFNNKLAEKLARKKDERYADVVRHIRTKLRFAMLKATLISIRGYRGKPEKKEASIMDISFNLIPQVDSSY